MQLLDKKHFEIIKIAPKHEDRAPLAKIYVEEGRTTATDGHRLLSVVSHHTDTTKEDEQTISQLCPSVQWSSNKTTFTITSSTVRRVLKNMTSKAPKGPEERALNKIAVGLKKKHDGEQDTLACVTAPSVEASTDIVEEPLNTAHYPNYQKIMPNPDDLNNTRKYAKVGLSAKYLKEVCTLLEKYDKNHLITLHIARKETESKPIVITADDFEGTSATAIIMPMKLSGH